jgi:phage terminase small subunit
MAKSKKEELKEQLYKLIDSIDDEQVLLVLNEEVVPYVVEGKGPELSGEQLHELDEAIKEADEGNTISYQEFKKNMDEWVTKLKSTRDSI